MIKQPHYLFLLSQSPWPLLCSLSSFNLTVSLILFLKNCYLLNFFFSISLLAIASFFWWGSYSNEFNIEGKSSMNLEKGLKFSMILFISSEIFFFFSFFWSYFHYFLSPILEIGMVWPPNYVLSFNYINIPLINTLTLMTSGVTITLSHALLTQNFSKSSNLLLFLTIKLGVIFTFFQIKEYKSSFFSISDGSFGSSFFMLTGFHGIHVLIGTAFLITILYLLATNKQSKGSFLSFELASWYWHFVDVVWIFLYTFLYYLGN